MINSTPPKITIGITAYNAADTVARAINSALEQDWPDTEIIIVNDASTDSTPEIIATYKDNPVIRVFHQETNKGVAAARNIILKNAKGDFIAFFDDDDISDPSRIKKQYEILKAQYSPLALCHTARRQFYPDGSERIEPTPGCGGKSVSGSNMFARILTGKPVRDGFGSLATCSLMMPRTVFETIGLYDEEFRRSEDMDFTLRFALAGGNFIGCAEPLVTQEMTRSSEKSLNTEKLYHEKIYHKYAAQLGQAETDFARKWLNLRHVYMSGNKKDFISHLLKLFITHPVLSAQKIIWTLPNFGFNSTFARFHRSQR